MATDVTVDNGGGDKSGGGGGGSFLTRKQGPFPMWVWIAGFVGAVLLYRQFTGKSSSSSTTQSNGSNGNGQAPNIFFLPQGANDTSNGSTIPITVNRNPGNGGSTGVSNFQGSNPPRVTSSRVTPIDQASVLDGIASHFGTSAANLTTLDNVSNPNMVTE